MKSTHKRSNLHGQGENFALGPQRNLYSTDLHWGLALGVTQILGLALGVTQILRFLDINMLVYSTQHFCLGHVDFFFLRDFALQWNIGLTVFFLHYRFRDSRFLLR